MVERVFLTDTRRNVLSSEFEGADSTLESHKSRIRSRSRMALSELVEVAESNEIDNEDVFDPREIHALLEALFGDLEEIQPYHEAYHESAEARRSYFREYEYEKQLAEDISHIDTIYGGRLLDPNPPRTPEESFARNEKLAELDHSQFKDTHTTTHEKTEQDSSE